MNKVLRGALLGAIILLAINELMDITLGFMLGFISEFYELHLSEWSTALRLVQNCITALMQICLVIAGISLVAGNTKSVPAIIGGGLLSITGLAVVVQDALWWTFRMQLNLEAMHAVNAKWVLYIIIIALTCAYILIAVHYRSTAMLVLGIVWAVVKWSVQLIVYLINQGQFGVTAFTLILSLCGVLVFVIVLVYLILWFRNVPKK